MKTKQTKRLSLMLAALLMLTVMPSYYIGNAAVKERETMLLGDVTMDGRVNTGDAVYVLRYVAGMATLNAVQMILADITESGNVNTGDCVYILRVAAGLEQTSAIEVDLEPETTPTESPAPDETPVPTGTPEPTTDNLIMLGGDSIEFDGSGATVNGAEVTITDAGVYTVRGTLSNGRIIIDASNESTVELVFDGVNITCLYSAPVYVVNADKSIITLAEGSVNAVTDTPDYVFEGEEDEPKAAIFAADDLRIAGSGALTVNGNYNNGIMCKDDLRIAGGDITVVAVNHGLRGNDSVEIKEGVSLDITAGNDGIQTDNTEDEEKGYVEFSGSETIINATGDGIQADRLITVEGGSVTIESAKKGLKCSGSVQLTGGRLEINATEDGINSATDFSIETATVIIEAGEDGIQADTTLTVTSGTLDITSGKLSSTVESGKGLKAVSLLTVIDGTIEIDSYEDSIHCDAAIEIKDGHITVASDFDGIQAETVLTIDDGTFNVTCGGGTGSLNETSMKAFKGLTAVTVNNGVFTVNSRDDAFHSDNTITINGGSFDIRTSDDAFHADMILNVTGGTMDISSCYEGFEAEKINLSGGNVKLTASDDAMNAVGSDETSGGGPGGRPGGPGGGGGMPGGNSNALLSITGGYFYVTSNGDGLDSNGSISMTGGTCIVNGSTSGGNGILDYDISFTMSGGYLLGIGTSDMMQTPASSNMRVLKITFSSNQSANALVHIENASGTDIMTYAPTRSYRAIVLCTPDIAANTSHSLYIGGSCSGTSVNGLYSGGTYSGGTFRKSFTTSSSGVTSVSV